MNKSWFDIVFGNDRQNSPPSPPGTFFKIQNPCKGQSGDDCENNELCVWHKQNSKCVPAGLFLKDTNDAEYTLDTGSSIASFSNIYCEQEDIATSGIPITRNYGSFKDVIDTPTKYPRKVLGTMMHPTCSSVHLAETPKYGGLVGASTTRNQQVAYHSLMDAIPENDRRLIVNKQKGTVCIGEGCRDSRIRPAKQWHPFVRASKTTDFIAVESYNGTTNILDTGSTFTSKVSDDLCLVGYDDIDYLNVDYDNKQVDYIINTQNVNKICSPEAS